VAMTKQKIEELEGAGADPLLHKADMGGLIGALLSMMASIHSPNPRDTFPACIPHVSRMYLDDLLGYMYPACIPHVSCI
jgi:hypothetical protein